jgi:hypothetical protein
MKENERMDPNILVNILGSILMDSYTIYHGFILMKYESMVYGDFCIVSNKDQDLSSIP